MITELFQQKKSLDEITTRMKEALSQIRHTKSERPVFSPEFLARIKRIIVFNPLDGPAMEGICRKLVSEMQQTWTVKRGKTLEVPESLMTFIARQAHLQNEKSNNKEGGRLVRKLIAEWIEARIQREITLRPAEYKTCTTLTVEFVPPDSNPPQETPLVPSIAVHFRSRTKPLVNPVV
jgi:ATP-dependent Clp protease ATP-binding subunit ClpA